ncbi:MAG TPA: hypothetical protein VHW09_26940 [Bryobacteraceae bacterium]|jgi:hypothetical protein|nr:hypothetical protein [Bryobacteraceae bacterium]
MSDALFRQWVQTLPSCLDGKSFSEWIPTIGEWRNLACHIRRAGRSGIGFKEAYAVVPMTDGQHRYQHQHGELACLRKFTRDPQLICTLDNASPFEAERLAGEWFDAQVEKYRAMWRRMVQNGELPLTAGKC